MQDYYTRIAQSNIGKTLFDSIGLPSPPTLKRSPETSMEMPRGRILIAGALRAKVLRKLLNDLGKSGGTSLSIPQWDDADTASLFSKHNAQPQTKVEQLSFTQNSNNKFKAAIFDATGMQSPRDLKALYVFFHNALKSIKLGGRIIVLGLTQESCDSPEQRACFEGCLSFVRSVAKEVGAKGVNANFIEIEPGAEKNALASVTFLLSRKSSYVTGQSVKVCTTRVMPATSHKPLAGKTALVTGAAFGIGAETARVLARDGAVVVCLDIPGNHAPLTQFASSIGGHAIGIDLLAPNAVNELLQTITSQLGVLDIVVHNAGITRDKTLRNMRADQWDSVLDLNLEKIIAINKELLSKKALAKDGRIIGVSSISGIAGNFGQTNYACSKGGLAGYTESLAKQLPPGTTINAVAPGFIETRMTSKVPFVPRELGRRSNAFSQGGLPIDVAEVIAFFCQPAARSVNGNVLRVCGQSLLGR